MMSIQLPNNLVELAAEIPTPQPNGAHPHELDIAYVGLDVGYAEVNMAIVRPGRNGSKRLIQYVFPAVFGSTEDLSSASDMSLGQRTHATRFTYGSDTYYIGEEAILYSRHVFGSRQDKTRIGSEEEKILALYALAGKLKLRRCCVFTGLPVAHYHKKADLVKAWQGQHTVWLNDKLQTIDILEVKTAYQPYGGLFDYFFDLDGRPLANQAALLKQACGVLDIGYNTTDLAVLSRMSLDKKASAGYRVGVRNVYEMIQARIQEKYGVVKEDYQLRQIIREKTLHLGGEAVNIEEIVDSAIRQIAANVVAHATKLWEEYADDLALILLIGGGAALLGHELKQRFPYHGAIVNDPAGSIARGFAKYAQRQDLWQCNR